jgi:uncharacterized protein YjiS (DUF1127 family)
MYVDMIGYVAAALVFATFYARNIVWLRSLAISSNIAFISYGALDDLWPIVVLHLSLLPVNVIRLFEILATFGYLQNCSSTRRNNSSLLCVFRRWHRREQQRRELAMMSGRDFGDLPVPTGLIRQEQRRWPWQPWTQGWRAIREDRNAEDPASTFSSADK